MSHTDTVTKIRICYTLYQNGISPELIPKQLGVHRATVYRWIKGSKLYGINKFIRNFKQSKKSRRQPRKTDVITKLHIYEIREKYHHCCGEKIKYFLEKDYNQEVSISTIYRVLNEKYQLKSKWKKYCKRGHVKSGVKPREAIQTDTVDLGSLYAFTAVDTYSREASVIIKKQLTAIAGKDSLKKQLEFFGTIEHMQKDGGSEFKKEWLEYAKENISSIRTAKPYKKNEQAFIERFNGILRKECLGYHKYKKKDIKQVQEKVDRYLDYYHNVRPHLSLDMKTPNEYAMSHLT